MSKYFKIAKTLESSRHAGKFDRARIQNFLNVLKDPRIKIEYKNGESEIVTKKTDLDSIDYKNIDTVDTNVDKFGFFNSFY